MSDLIPHPLTGEVLDVKHAATDQLADAHADLNDDLSDLRSYKRAIDDEIVERMDHEGKRTFHLDATHTIEVSKPTEREWDVGLLIETLDRLVADGIISERKAQMCVKHEPRPVAAELRPLETDPRCQRQIGACFTEVPARRSVRVKR